jgi:NAD(P) transhydrogenase
VQSYDLIAIGSGPAGEKGAAQAAYFGKRVALIERAADPGGACVNTGTIPSKILRESALYFSGLKQRGLYGIDYSLREGLTVKDFTHRKDVIVEHERSKVQENLAAHHVEVFAGAAAFEDAHSLVVTDEHKSPVQLRGEVILIATGSRPHRPAEIPYDDEVIFDSDSILKMDRIPRSLAVVGGGVIGCEYASIFAALGVKVSLVDVRDRVLLFLDPELSELLRNKLTEMGVEFFLEERVVATQRSGREVKLTLKSGKTIEPDAVLFAAGRRGWVEGLGLEKIDLALNQRGYIEVDEFYQTSVPGIYAAGDVIGFPALASTSMEQGRVAVCHAFGFKYKQRMTSQLPMGVYTIPEISSIGETEQSCREKGIEYEVGRARYANNARAAMAGDLTGLLKLVFRRVDRQLLGVHIIGESATELIHVGMMVLELGETIDRFVDFVFNFPTLSEMFKYAAYDGLGNLAGHKLREG